MEAICTMCTCSGCRILSLGWGWGGGGWVVKVQKNKACKGKLSKKFMHAKYTLTGGEGRLTCFNHI